MPRRVLVTQESHTLRYVSSNLAAATKKKESHIRIYAKKTDYYDSIQAYGQDDNIIYKRLIIIPKRNSKIFNLVIKNPSVFKFLDEFGSVSNGINTLSLTTIALILFCGRPYPCLVYKSKDKYDDIKTHYCYSLSDVRDIVNQYGGKNQKSRWNNKKSKWEWFTSKQEIWVPKIFELSKHLKHDKSLYELHHQLGVPVLAYVFNWSKTQITINPTLKKYKFYKVIDSYTAFQDISMFISGILGGVSPPMIEISDTVKIAKHGYDKWSFRKEPWKKI